MPSPDKIQLAAVCFVTDMSECEDNIFGNSSNPPDYDFNPRDRCFNEGYNLTSCPDGYKLGGKKCPYGPYYSECVASCPSDYVICEEPNVGVGEPCGGKYASCTCTPCGAGYDYTTIPEGYVQDGEACLDCDGIQKYKIKPNPCDGFQDCGSMGGAAGAETCQSGDVIKYDNCKPCPNLGKYTTCPQGMICEYEECGFVVHDHLSKQLYLLLRLLPNLLKFKEKEDEKDNLLHHNGNYNKLRHKPSTNLRPNPDLFLPWLHQQHSLRRRPQMPVWRSMVLPERRLAGHDRTLLLNGLYENLYRQQSNRRQWSNLQWIV